MKHMRNKVSYAMVVGLMATMVGCGDSSDQVTVAAPRVSGQFESIVGREFQQAIEGGADLAGPSAVSIPGLGVVLLPAATIPRREVSTDDTPIDHEAESRFVQEPAIYFAPYGDGVPERIMLGESAPHRLRTVAAAAGQDTQFLVAVTACERAYYHEKNDHRPYDCVNELWSVSLDGHVASPIGLPADVMNDSTAIPTLAVTSSEIRLVHGTGTFTAALGSPDWVRVGDGSSGVPRRSCGLADGTLLSMASGDDSVMERLPVDSHEWTRDKAVSAAPVGLNELFCGSHLAYRIAFGPSDLPMIRLSATSTEVLKNPLGDRTGPTPWQLDQVSDDLVAAPNDGSAGLVVLSPTEGEPRLTDGRLERFTDSDGRTRQFAAFGGAPFSTDDHGNLNIGTFGE